MFKDTPRCNSMLLIILASMAMLISGTAFAQEHGAGITKACGDPVRTCDTDDDCADDDECTANTCDTTTNTNTTYNCTFTVTNLDDFEDELTITAIQDAIGATGGDVIVTFPDLTVDAVIGNASCTDLGGGVLGLPCTIGPATDILAVGQVRFRSNTYEPTMDDPDPLSDQVTGTYFDQCDGLPSTSCNPDQANLLQASSNQDLETGCIESPITCDDGNACTTDSCDPATGCVFTPVPCDDGDACTDDSCDPATGLCVFTPNINCDDGDACTDDSCDPATGLCVNTPNVDCDDGDACTDDSCDPATGLCVNTPNVDCDDGDACTDDSCDPATGLCVNTPTVNCDDGDACTDDSCDPATGLCVNTPNVDCDDGDACTDDSCDPATGLCVNTPNIDCDDGDVCTDDSCDPATGACVNVPADPLPAECLDAEICRTPGFWGTHAGDSKNNSTNITQALIDAAGGLDVCGTIIDNTDVGNSTSAIEAICIRVQGDSTRQLVRQLTAAALNCVIGECSPDTSDLIASCNDTCTGSGTLSVNECIGALDCFNNGGSYDSATGSCTTGAGTCDISGAACDDNSDCTGAEDFCVGFESCHDRDLCPDFDDDGEINGSDFCFEPPGPAGSSGQCNAARKNDVNVP